MPYPDDYTGRLREEMERYEEDYHYRAAEFLPRALTLLADLRRAWPWLDVLDHEHDAGKSYDPGDFLAQIDDEIALVRKVMAANGVVEPK